MRPAVVALLMVLGTAATPRVAFSLSRETDGLGSTPLLDVPYLSQTEDLCGGAAVAMVLRYWGERQIFAEDFAALVDRGASGIRTDVLASEVQRLGWQSFPFSGGASETGAEWSRQHVDSGRPIVALIEVGPGRYHYVVIVAWTDALVIAHDPARAPFHVMSSTEFDRVWAAAGHWALLILPAEGRLPETRGLPPAPTMNAPRASACGTLVQEMVQRARAGSLQEAEGGLVAASQLCPRDPTPWRELAGIRFLQSRWNEASTFAERAAALDPADGQGWDLLATSRFLDDRPSEALDAWNRIGRPTVDLVRVTGLQRTRHPAVVALVNVPPRQMLTSSMYRRAARRLDELPSATLTRLAFRPVGEGLAEIEAAVVESPLVPRGVVPLATAAVRAWIQREMRLDVAAPAGSGELWTFAYRWWEARPRIIFSLGLPVTPRLPGVVTIEGLWQTSSYETPDPRQSETSRVRRDERRRAAVTFADWALPGLRWQASAALDRWAQDSHVSVGVALDARFADDRVSLGLESASWLPLGSGGRFAQGGVSSAWRSTTDVHEPSWSAVAGVAAASGAAPLDLWPGAGTGLARAPLLRAHPLLQHGVVVGPVFGRRLWHGNVEYQHPLRVAPAAALRLAAFADTASAWRRVDEQDRRFHSDVGAGVRVVLPGTGGIVRADVACGLRDRRVVFSAGWQRPWPGR